MMAKCISCPRTFNSGAALNFHMKKIHDKQESSSTKIEPRRKKSAIRMLEFGDLEGVRDESIDPFRLGTIKLKVDPKTNSKEILISLPPPKATTRSSSQEQTKNNRNLKRKSTSSDSEDSDCDDNESCDKSIMFSPSMPKLIPQVDPVPNKITKKSKQAKHLKYTLDEDQSPESISRPSTSLVQKLTVSEDKFSVASSQGSRHHGSLQAGSSTEKPQILPNTSGRTRKVRQISGGSSSQYSGNSMSGDDNQSTTSSIAKSGAGRPKSSKTTTCEVCGQTGFKTPNQFFNHLEIHEGKRPFVCPVCGMGYETDLKLLEHVSIRHLKEANFKCSTCNQGYKTERGLANHWCKQ